MFIVKALIFLVTLPLRLIGTVLALALKLVGIIVTILASLCGAFTGSYIS